VSPEPLTLKLVEGTFAICRLGGADAVPPWATSGELFSITRSPDELSIVCRQDRVPDGIRCERGWRCLRVAGTIPFSAVGILASLTAPLAAVGICVFAISTFDTDYLLVKAESLKKAVETFQQQGHVIQAD
jgi:hypothetical protein